MTGRRLRTVCLLLTLLMVPTLTWAQNIGTIRGQITDDQTGGPLGYANVTVKDTNFGAMTLEDGTFSFVLPAGTYTVVVTYLGYESVTRDGVVINGERTTTLDVELKPSVALAMDAFVVEGDAPVVDVKSSSETKKKDSEDLTAFAVDNVQEAMALEAGITMKGGDLYVRGGRSGEVSMMIDGVPVNDPLGGAVQVSNVAVAEAEAVIGGMDAEFGNAQSAVFNIVTREGGSQFEGSVRYWTDDYGRQDKTYTNYDRLAVGLGGPLVSDDFRWFLSAEAQGSDGEDLTLDRREEWSALGGFLKFKDRASSSLNVQNKLTWRVNPDLKLNLEGNISWDSNDRYIHNWNQEGYVNRLHLFERLELSGETDPNQGEQFFYVVRGTLPVLHGPWYQAYVQDKERQRQGLPTDFEKVLIKYKPSGAGSSVYEVVDAMRVKSAFSGTEFLVLTDELFDGFMDTLSRWSYIQNDSSQVYYNSAEHTPTSTSFTNSVKFVAVHNVSDNVFYKLALTRLGFERHSAVDGKSPVEYSTAGLPATLHNGATVRSVSGEIYYTDPNNPFLASAYDYPNYFDRNSTSWIAKFDLTSNRWKSHKIKTGFLAQYNDMYNEQLTAPGRTRILVDDQTGRVLGEAQGRSANIFHNYAPLTAFYVQDRWEYKGMVVNGGVRYDLFSPGSGVDILLRAEGVDPTIKRYKQSLSPRLGLAFPITDRDVFHFHYGRFIQAPSNNDLFQTQDPNAGVGILGNPDLKPEITISYQAGVKHQFTEHVVGDFAIFYKDIYDLISSTTAIDTVSGNQFGRYINKAYASARGLEITLNRQFADNYGGQIAYTLSYADGVASDAEFGATSAAGLTHLPTKELPLRWDERHSVSASLRLADPGSWGGSLIYSFGSGFPYTPAFPDVRRQDPELENSRRYPATHSLSMQAEKYFNVWGQDLTLFFDGRNLLDQDQIANHDPGIFPALRYAQNGYTTYLTETGNYGGAYRTDLDGDGEDEYHPVEDPRVYSPHRIFRIGFGFEF
ncbi:MAG: TonB-dependent receptor [Candidatus Krumholzibacteriia bacterium]|nr:TonB-dependent receptor [bacterium]MCB9513279.1 TonB-dependent receptor [Candidatus Latescibacterota bacterium]MCB9514740.1 TonB-dependent receptor [Candidatus Latescibacterota bacterium]